MKGLFVGLAVGVSAALASHGARADDFDDQRVFSQATGGPGYYRGEVRPTPPAPPPQPPHRKPPAHPPRHR